MSCASGGAPMPEVHVHLLLRQPHGAFAEAEFHAKVG